MREICTKDRAAHAEKAIEACAKTYGAKFPKAIAKITDDRAELPAAGVRHGSGRTSSIAPGVTRWGEETSRVRRIRVTSARAERRRARAERWAGADTRLLPAFSPRTADSGQGRCGVVAGARFIRVEGGPPALDVCRAGARTRPPVRSADRTAAAGAGHDLAFEGRSGAWMVDARGGQVIRNTLRRPITLLPDPTYRLARVVGVDEYALSPRAGSGDCARRRRRATSPGEPPAGPEGGHVAAWLSEWPGLEIICRDRALFCAEGATHPHGQGSAVVSAEAKGAGVGRAAPRTAGGGYPRCPLVRACCSLRVKRCMCGSSNSAGSSSTCSSVSHRISLNSPWS